MTVWAAAAPLPRISPWRENDLPIAVRVRATQLLITAREQADLCAGDRFGAVDRSHEHVQAVGAGHRSQRQIGIQNPAFAAVVAGFFTEMDMALALVRSLVVGCGIAIPVIFIVLSGIPVAILNQHLVCAGFAAIHDFLQGNGCQNVLVLLVRDIHMAGPDRQSHLAAAKISIRLAHTDVPASWPAPGRDRLPSRF